MSDLLTRAELTMLARTLHVPVSRIGHLERLGADGLRELRTRMSAVLFDEQAAEFRRLGAFIPLVPLKIAMPIVQRVIKPEMAGRAGGAVGLAHPEKVSSVMTLLSPAYAAETAPYLDPRAVAELAHLAPADAVVSIAREILRRGDYVTAGLLVDAATPELVRAVEAGIDDDAAIMRAGAYVHSREVLNGILRVFVAASPQRVGRLVGAAVHGDTELRLAALSVLSRIDDDLIAVLGDELLLRTPQDDLGELLRTYVREGATQELLAFASALTPEALAALAALLESLAGQATGPLREELRAVIAAVPAASRRPAS